MGITATDLQEILGETYEGVQIKAMLKDADVDHDAKISLDEFQRYMRHPEIGAHHLDAGAVIVDQGLQKGDKAVQPMMKQKVTGDRVYLQVGSDPHPPIQVEEDRNSKKCCVVS